VFYERPYKIETLGWLLETANINLVQVVPSPADETAI
jgi:hypothetical protein